MIRRNFTIFILAALCCLTASAPAHARRPLPPEVFNIQGDSQSLAAVIFPLKEAFENDVKMRMLVTGELSAVKGLAEADRGVGDAVVVAMSFDELNRRASDAGLMQRNKALTQHSVLVNDVSYSVIVNPKNPLNKLSTRELRKIFSGACKDWSEMDGPKVPVSVVWGEWSTGASWVLADRIMEDEPLLKNVVTAGSIQEIAEKVAADPSAIGIIPSTGLSPAVKALKTPELKIDGPIILVTVGFPTNKHFKLMELIKGEGRQLIGY